MRQLIHYLKPYWKAVLLAPLLMILEVTMDLLQPVLIASIIDDGVLAGDLLHIKQTGALMVGVALVGLLGGVGCTIYSSIAAQNFGSDVRNTLFAKVQSFSFRNVDRFHSGSLVTRLTNDVVQVQTLVMMSLRVLVRAPLLAVGSLIMAFTISPKLAWILTAAIPLLSVVLYYIINKTFTLFGTVQQKLDNVNGVLQENTAGIRVVKAFVRSGFEKLRFGRANDDYSAAAVKATRLMALMSPIMMLIMNTSIVAVLWFGGHEMWNGAIQVGELVAFINYATQMLFALTSVSMLLTFVSKARASGQRITEVLNTNSEITVTKGALKQGISGGEITFDNVSFSYEEQDGNREAAIRQISFTAHPGTTLAILGSTGSGKSSLVHLIPRLYDVNGGHIHIDGIDVRQFDPIYLRSQIGLVLQEAVLFSGTIQDNIRYGRPDASQVEVEAAAKAAQAHEFISQMADGYDTRLGQRGINLSGGQKQRISIARALLVKPPILILDDSTSAVDLGTESRIQKELRQLLTRSTNIIIAQRISSVVDADRIIVLEDGAIAAEGTHDELLRSSEIYQEIYKSQTGKEETIYG